MTLGVARSRPRTHKGKTDRHHFGNVDRYSPKSRKQIANLFVLKGLRSYETASIPPIAVRSSASRPKSCTAGMGGTRYHPTLRGGSTTSLFDRPSIFLELSWKLIKGRALGYTQTEVRPDPRPTWHPPLCRSRRCSRPSHSRPELRTPSRSPRPHCESTS